MKLGIVSDLHLEFSSIEIPCDGLDVLVLAGDIHANIKALHEWLNCVLGTYPILHIVIVPGNHEFFGKTVPGTLHAMACLRSERCHVLLNDSAIIGGVTFVGGTLWARMPDEYKPQVRHAMSDFKRIQGLNFGVMEQQFDDCVGAVTDACDGATGPVVVVTHFGPTLHSVHPKYGPANTPINRYYSNDLGETIKSCKPALWVQGHTHVSLDYSVGETRVVCNPRGYSKVKAQHPENPDFELPKVLELIF